MHGSWMTASLHIKKCKARWQSLLYEEVRCIEDTSLIVTIYKHNAVMTHVFQDSFSFQEYNVCRASHTPYNRLSGQQKLSGTQIISTSHGMTGRNFFPFYLLFGF
jgi:hypothetical protein